MIRAEIFSLGRKITWYKRALIAFFALNVLAVTTGAVLSWHYWQGGFHQHENLSNGLRKLQDFNALDTELSRISVGKDLLSRKEAFVEMRKWHKLLKVAGSLGIVSDWEVAFEDPTYTNAWLKSSRERLHQMRGDHIQDLIQRIDQQSIQRKTLIWIGAITLLFGIILPLIVIYFLTKALHHAHQLLVEAARELIKDWRQAIETGGPEPFKNHQFWVELALIVSHHLGRQVHHPIVQISSELAGLVQSEMEISRKKAA